MRKEFTISLFIWLVLISLIMGGLIWWGSQNLLMCWDGILVDEDLLVTLCGINEEEFWESGLGECKEGVNAITAHGGCEPDWPSIGVMTSSIILGFTLVFWIITFFTILIITGNKKNTEINPISDEEQSEQ
ncbi:MAG: hypothetical protein JXA19_06070 [Anaerolineales bacterium]|nr:hypothetical protein [Anaerolineales bacterium]